MTRSIGREFLDGGIGGRKTTMALRNPRALQRWRAIFPYPRWTRLGWLGQVTLPHMLCSRLALTWDYPSPCAPPQMTKSLISFPANLEMVNNEPVVCIGGSGRSGSPLDALANEIWVVSQFEFGTLFWGQNGLYILLHEHF